MCNMPCKVIFKSGLHLTVVCNFYSNFSFIVYGALFKRSSMTCNKKKMMLSNSQTIPFCFTGEKAGASCLFFHVSLRKKSTGALLTFLTKSLLPTVLNFKCLAASQVSQRCHKSFSSQQGLYTFLSPSP